MGKRRKRLLGSGLVIVGVVVAGVTLGSAVVVLMAFGLGSLFTLFLPLSLFEASLLSVVAVVGVLAAAWRTFEHVGSYNAYQPRGADDDYDYDHDDDVEDLDDMDEEIDWSERPVVHATACARVGRNSPCPCGSGKKYKRCCGASRANG